MDMPTVLICIGGAAAFAFLLFNKKGKKKATKPSTNATGWMFGPFPNGVNYSRGMPERPTLQGSGWVMNFPDASGEVDAVVNFSPPSLVGAKQVVMRFAITGAGFTVSEKPEKTPYVSFMLQRKGDDWTTNKPSYRWYSNQMIALKAGEFTLTVPLDTSGMHNMQGQHSDDAGLADALRELDNIAVCFGHDSGQSHGVYATEPSRLTLLSLDVVR